MSTFTFDATEVRQCPLFRTSSVATEHDCFTTELQEPINVYAAAYAPYEKAHDAYEKARPFFKDSKGATVDHPYLCHLEEQGRAADNAFDKALTRLNDALTDNTIACLAEGLELAGVTDPATIFEICRVVILGGTMWDGKGFTSGEVPVSVTPSTGPSVACPHCGLPTELGEARCFSCERLIG